MSGRQEVQAAPRVLGAGATRVRRRQRWPRTQSLAHIPLVLVAVTMIFPFWWMVATSLKHPSKQFVFPPQLIPDPVYFQNYVDLFNRSSMALFLFNSTKIAVLSVVGVSLTSSLAAFAFARMRFRGKEPLFAVLLATMMIPSQVTIIPTFVIMKWLGWIDNHAALIVPSFFGSAFSVFLLRQFYRTIPQELVDSAQIDGAGFTRIYWSIFLPLGLPALATVAIFNFLWSWNDLLGPLIFLYSEENFTLTQGLNMLRGRFGTGAALWGQIMAGALIGVVPMLVLYFFGQKHFVQSLARTGIKG
ncbi:MAG TPA: carbohydrate ABC transporter permease [Chloroflexota bacterium]|jgi:ABC-type glycerol-3-phosphate transport system permease component